MNLHPLYTVLTPRNLLDDFFGMQREYRIRNIRKANQDMFASLIPNILSSLDMDHNALIDLIKQNKLEGEKTDSNAKIKIVKNGEVLIDSNISDLTPEQLNNVEKTLHNLVADGWGLSKAIRPDLTSALAGLSKDKDSCSCQNLGKVKPEIDDTAVKVEKPVEEQVEAYDNTQNVNNVLESLKDTTGIEKLRSREASLKEILENAQLTDEQKIQELKKLIS